MPDDTVGADRAKDAVSEHSSGFPDALNRLCPICGSSDATDVFCDANIDAASLNSYAFASRKLPEYMHHRLILCPDCDLVYANPAPRIEALASAYEEAAYDSGEEAEFAARTYGAYTRKVAATLPDNCGAIDIGCGDGVFLEKLLDLGFDGVSGIEPSIAPILAAKPRIKPLIRQGLFSAAEFEPSSAILITCFQTIEHVYDPLQLCVDAHGLLKEGGALFLIGHNRDALSAKLLKTRSPIFDIEHLQLFSAASFRRLLTEAGYKSVRVFPIFNRYPLHYLVKLFPIPAANKIALLNGIKRLRAGYLPVTLALGNLGAVGYK
ncbi:MAG: class I SAM-dependent methyltransferase [Capsulimonadaceae bacterium]|nr:class I SAM-dependent methyltransferase [Capsulimonadaceae bacterium]